mgnify:CR=1 FL=1
MGQIFGIGTDIIEKSRFKNISIQRLAKRILANSELLAFENATIINQSKMAVLCASLIAGILGGIVIAKSSTQPKKTSVAPNPYK